MHRYINIKNGGMHPSFNAITASGVNGSTLHFVNNVNEIKAD